MKTQCIFQRMGRYTLYNDAWPWFGTGLFMIHNNLTHRARSIWDAGYADATLAPFGLKLGALA